MHVSVKPIIKEENEKWEEVQKKKKMQLYFLSEAEQQVHSDAIQRLKQVGMSGELIEQCMAFGATIELLEELFALGVTPSLLEFWVKSGGTPATHYETLTKKITPQDAGFLSHINDLYHYRYNRKARFNSWSEFDEFSKKSWDEFKKDSRWLWSLGLTTYITFLDFLFKTPGQYRNNRSRGFVSSPGFQGVGSASTRKPKDQETSIAMGKIPDHSQASYAQWDEDLSKPLCSIYSYSHYC
jgi:hypothetical protein